MKPTTTTIWFWVAQFYVQGQDDPIYQTDLCICPAVGARVRVREGVWRVVQVEMQMEQRRLVVWLEAV